MVAFVGNFPIKGIEYFIDAAKLSPKNIEFRVYGKGQLQKALEERAEGHVRFMGFEKDIIDRYYNDVDVLVVPSIIPEALSLVAVDAKSLDLPVIVTTPGGQAEIVENGINGYHVPMCDSQAIATNIIYLSNNLTSYNKMARQAYESFAPFTYKVFKKKLQSLFETVVGRS